MYYCTDCGNFFEKPIKFKESDYSFGEHCEISLYCPHCKSSRIKQAELQYCHCCGKRLKKGQRIYCSRACQKNGDFLYSLQKEQKRRMLNSPIYVIVRKLEEYNAKNHTALSYGRFVAKGNI